tara:strand:+ start:1570 stop:1728 length:159 start_codon:yes stop_codon:yes gene_type:complete
MFLCISLEQNCLGGFDTSKDLGVSNIKTLLKQRFIKNMNLSFFAEKTNEKAY